MERTGNVTGYTTAEVSELVRGYGFNEDAHQRTGWQSGKDRGRYGRGKPAAHGVTVTRNHIADWIQNWNCTFEEYLLEISADDRRRQQQEQQRRQQAAAQAAEQRRRQMEQEQRRRQAEAEERRRQAEWERQQRELERQRQAEWERQQRELELQRQLEEERRRKAEWERLAAEAARQRRRNRENSLRQQFFDAVQQKQFQQGVSIAQTLLKEGFDLNMDAWNYGYCLANLSRYKEAVSAYDSYLRQFATGDPDSLSKVLRNKSICLKKLKHWQDALDALSSAQALARQHNLPSLEQITRELEPLRAQAATARALAQAADLFKKEQYEDVLGLLEQAAKQNPDQMEGRDWFRYGYVLAAHDRESDAKAAYQKALSMDGSNSAAANNLGNIFLHEGDLDMAEEYLCQAINTLRARENKVSSEYFAKSMALYEKNLHVVETRRKDAARKAQEERQRQLEDERRLEEEHQRQLEEQRRLEEERQRQLEEARRLEEERQRQLEEARRLEEERQRRLEEARRRQEEDDDILLLL